MHINELPYFQRWFIIATIIGIIAGLGALLFYYAIIFFSYIFINLFLGISLPLPLGEGSYLNFAITPSRYILIPISTTLGGLLSGLIVYRFAPEAEGHGTDAAIDTYHNRQGKVRKIVIPVKTLASAITIGSGGSAGREGPTAQISSGLGSIVADLLHLSPEDRRRAVAVGIGAGIGTIFKAPIGGAILGAEILYKRDIEPEIIYPSLIASAIGYSIFGSIVGFTPIFGYYSGVFNPLRLPFYLILGLFSGLLAIFYVKTFYNVHDLFRNLKIKKYFKPALGGLITGIIALFFPEVMGIGYGWVQIFISNDLNIIPTFGLPLILILILLPVMKILATSFSIGSGGSGGVFAPGMVIGASVGLLFGILFNFIFPSIVPSYVPFVIIGMLSFFAAAGKVPLSVMIMVVEMTGSLQLLPAAMIAVAASYLVSGNNSIYKSQVPTRRDSPAHMGEYNTPVLTSIKINEIQIRDIKIMINEPVRRAKILMEMNGLISLPVVDENRKFLGVVYLSDLESDDESPVKNFVKSGITYVHMDSSAEHAWEVMAHIKSTWAPVVEKGEFIGIVTMNDLLKAYKQKVASMRS
ncbi:MAG: chloride channel protein [Thermoplasmata archaeon]|nr:chloride channel protein [Thermoplasmatales archaeon]PMP74228.1 MAG: chloride channel protein [Aciduliprofundum sp.]HEU12783.1 chloride channel protein [Euryarchaeota archaeon]